MGRRRFIASSLVAGLPFIARTEARYPGPGDAGYEEARKLFNSDLDLKPADLAKCRSEEEVKAAALAKVGFVARSATNSPIGRALKRHYGQAGPLPFYKVSGGFYHGHEDLAGSSELIAERVIGTPGLIFQVNTLGGAITRGPDSAYPDITLKDYRTDCYGASLPKLQELKKRYDPACAVGLIRARWFLKTEDLRRESAGDWS